MNAPRISGFENLQFVRSSSTCMTWKALQRTLERLVWIRTLKPDATPAQQNAFETVARAFAHLRHPNLIQVFDVARDENNAPYLVLEAVEGPTLAEVLQRETRIDPVRAAKIGMGIADALDAAWKQSSLIHRTLKPENLCLTPEGIVKLVDFGAATLIQPGVDPLANDGGMVIGTPHYMAPEQAQGLHTLDFHADMYGLGALLYHLVTGAAPFAGESDPAQVMALQVHGTLPSPREKDPKGIPAAVDRVLGRLLMKDPHARYDWWQDAVADLQRISLGRSVPRDPGADPDSVGTLEPYLPPHKRKRSVTSPPDAGSSGIVQPEPESPCGPPAALQTVLWFLLMACMALLAVYRWRQSGIPPASRDVAGRVDAAGPDALPDRSAASAAVAEAPPEVPHPAENDVAVASPAAGNGVTAVPRRAENSAAEVPAPAAAPLPPEGVGPLSAALRNEVSEALRRGDFETARERLAAGLESAAIEASSPPDSPLRKALEILAAIGNPHDFLGSFLMERYRDQTFTVHHRGRRLTVAPERYSAGLLSVRLLREDGSRPPWTLDLDTLDATERFRLLGPGYTPPGEDPAASAAYAVLALQAGDAAAARRIAARLPALAPFLAQPPGP